MGAVGEVAGKERARGGGQTGGRAGGREGVSERASERASESASKCALGGQWQIGDLRSGARARGGNIGKTGPLFDDSGRLSWS